MSLHGPTDDNTPEEPDEAGASNTPYPHEGAAGWANDGHSTTDLPSLGPGANRITGETLLGCVGMLCLIATLALLGVSFGGLGLPLWLTALTPVLALSFAALGLGLMARVPTGSPLRSRDPRYPLTRAGGAPIVERPATLANRLMVAASAAPGVIVVAGYISFSFDPNRERGLFWGPIVMSVSGLALLIVGALVSRHSLPTPAIHWVRTPIQGRAPRAGLWLLGVGAVTTISGLFLAFISGAAWGYIVMGLLILASALAAMVYTFWRRRPLRHRLPPDPYAYSARRSDGPSITPDHDHPHDPTAPSEGE